MQQFFLNIEQVLDLFFAELPAGVYPTDRADDPDTDNRSYSSSELRAMSQLFANLYSNLDDIYENKFVTTIQPDGLNAWEVDYFAAVQDATLSFSTRQANLLAAVRAVGSISLPAISNIVAGILAPYGLSFAILPYSGQSNGTTQGAWLLGISQLGLDTFLALEDPLRGTGLGAGQTPLDCNLNYAAAGLTAQDLLNIQATAYTYEVQIYGNASAATLATIDAQLTAKEPARSTHIITNNAAGPTSSTVLDLGSFTGDTFTNIIDAGLFTVPAATYDVWDFGSFT